MSKDPAILFYPEVFIMGTIFMSDDEVGKYIRLLCYQHQHGGLIGKADFNHIVNGNSRLEGKFIECDDGFYNERLLKEMEKRNVKSNNLSAAVKKVWEKRKAMQLHCNSKAIPMEPKDRNKDKDIIKDIIQDLNNKAGTKYRESSTETKKLIRARLKEGFSLENFYTVNENMCKQWLKSELSYCLRPLTLYSNKFESYLNFIQPTKKESEYI